FHQFHEPLIPLPWLVCEPDKLLAGKIIFEHLQRDLENDCFIRQRRVHRMHLIGIHDQEFSCAQMPDPVINIEFKLSATHGKNLYRAVPVSVSSVISISSFKNKKLKRKTRFRYDQFM